MVDKKSPRGAKPKSSGEGKKNDGEKKRSAVSVILLILLIILILLLLIYVGGRILGKGGGRGLASGSRGVDTSRVYAQRGDSSERVDTSRTSSLPAEVSLVDTAGSSVASQKTARQSAKKDSASHQAGAVHQAGVDTLLRSGIDTSALALVDSADTLTSARADTSALDGSDTLVVVDSAAIRAAVCARDTVVPWVYADPSGGLHRQAVSVKLVANKVCRVEWSFDGVKEWKVYDGKPISVSKQATIYYKAVDSCGKKMDVRSKRYEFEMTASRCPSGMEIISAGGKEFCVDVYEWPNKKGAFPQPYISLYQAMDSCFSVRKRLCTTEEWTTACSGPEKWKYLYGESYEWNTCVTRDTTVVRSGSRPECRGYYGVFDMSGNLAEWTSTSAPQDRSFNNVMGGFWASGSQSRCADARYSYFPQNRHNPVGFRCCADAPPGTKSKGR